jgi:hypothetical protein
MESADAAAARQRITGDTGHAKNGGCGNDEDGAILHGDFLSGNPPSIRSREQKLDCEFLDLNQMEAQIGRAP